MEEEIWKDIPDYEGLYQISNLGRVKSLKRFVNGKVNNCHPVKERILKTPIGSAGYKKCDLSKNGKINTVNVHRIMAILFIPNPFNLTQINHKDSDRANNNLSNLEWVSPSYNVQHGWNNGRISSQLGKFGSLSHCAKPVIQYTKENVFVAEFGSIIEAAKSVGGYIISISLCCRNKRKTSKGFKWKYKNIKYEQSL